MKQSNSIFLSVYKYHTSESEMISETWQRCTDKMPQMAKLYTSKKAQPAAALMFFCLHSCVADRKNPEGVFTSWRGPRVTTSLQFNVWVVLDKHCGQVERTEWRQDQEATGF